jgi:hypothetical protein
MHENEGERMELGHEPVPGYRGVFFVAMAVGVVYLGIILGSTLF